RGDADAHGRGDRRPLLPRPRQRRAGRRVSCHRCARTRRRCEPKPAPDRRAVLDSAARHACGRRARVPPGWLAPALATRGEAGMSGLIDFHFLRPAWLLLLGVLPLLWWSWRRSRDDAGAWRAAVDAHLLPHLLAQGETRDGAGPWLAAALWALLVAALAGPAWDREPVPLYRNEAARVLALELAPSMLAQDVRPSRLERARYKLNDILTRSADMQTALIAYAGDAFVAAPLTDDVNTVRNLIDSLGPDTMPVAGNATGRAIERAVDLIHQAGLAQGELVLLADGVGADALAAARDAHAQGLDISVLGVGETGGAPVPLPGGGFLKDASGNIVVPRLDESDLRALAAAGGGRYARLSADASDLDTLLTDHQRGTAAGEPAEDA